MINPESAFNSAIRESLDGPGENYVKVASSINEQVLMRDLNYMQQDRIAQICYQKKN